MLGQSGFRIVVFQKEMKIRTMTSSYKKSKRTFLVSFYQSSNCSSVIELIIQMIETK